MSAHIEDEDDLENQDDLDGNAQNEIMLDESTIQHNIKIEQRNHWELLKPQLRDQLKMSKNVLWSEAAKARYHAQKDPGLFECQQTTARLANLGSLTNLPKPDNEVNKKVCVVYGDITQLKADCIIVPNDDGDELNKRVKVLAGEDILAEYDKSKHLPFFTANPHNLQKQNFPQVISFVKTPQNEDAKALNDACDRLLKNTTQFGTVAIPILSGAAYPRAGQAYYPLVGAVHVLLSNIRQKLDKPLGTEQCYLYIIVCQNEREKRVINDLMDLYFPHDYANELDDDLKEPEQPAVVVKSKKAKKRKSAKK